MTYNCHTLSHLPDCVKKLGPLWNYSNFPFESNNGVLVGYVKSPKGVLNHHFGIYKIKPISQKLLQTLLINVRDPIQIQKLIKF